MDPAPLVTIAIPNFNQGPFIADAMRSALAQTLREFELLILDNASTDDSWDRIRSFEDPRIRAMRHPTNMGMLRNWNACLATARGRYLKLLPADDLLEPACLSVCVDRMERTGAELCLASYGRITQAGHSIPAAGEQTHRDDVPPLQELLRLSWSLARFVQPVATFYRTEATREIGGFGTPKNVCGDFIAWSRLLVRGKVCVVSETLGHERVHPEQARTKSKALPCFRDMRSCVETMLAAARAPEARRALDSWMKELERDVARASLAALARGRAPDAIAIVRELGLRWATLHAYSAAAPDGFIRLWRRSSAK